MIKLILIKYFDAYVGLKNKLKVDQMAICRTAIRRDYDNFLVLRESLDMEFPCKDVITVELTKFRYLIDFLDVTKSTVGNLRLVELIDMFDMSHIETLISCRLDFSKEHRAALMQDLDPDR